MATSPTPRHLTDRDEEILLALDRCPLTVVQILKLSQAFSGQPFTSARGVQDRLHKLREADWVRSWPYAIANRGSPPDYFRLTPLGFRLLHGEHAVPPTKRHFSEVSIGHHHHTHCLADFIVHTLVAARRRAIRLAHFYRENTLQLRVGADVLLRPDCAFELHTPSGHQLNFLVELDGGTERIRSDKDTDAWQQKIQLYNLLQDRNYPDRFRVLVVTTRCSDRLQSILTLAAQNTTNSQRTLFYAVTLPDYLAQPDALYHPCFRDHRGNSIPLVAQLPPPGGALSRSAQR